MREWGEGEGGGRESEGGREGKREQERWTSCHVPFIFSLSFILFLLIKISVVTSASSTIRP